MCRLFGSPTAGHINGCGQHCWSQCAFQSFPALQGFGISNGELTGLCRPLPTQSAQFRARTRAVLLSGHDKWIIIRHNFRWFSISSIFSCAFSGTFPFIHWPHSSTMMSHLGYATGWKLLSTTRVGQNAPQCTFLLRGNMKLVVNHLCRPCYYIIFCIFFYFSPRWFRFIKISRKSNPSLE